MEIEESPIAHTHNSFLPNNEFLEIFFVLFKIELIKMKKKKTHLNILVRYLKMPPKIEAFSINPFKQKIT